LWLALGLGGARLAAQLPVVDPSLELLSRRGLVPAAAADGPSRFPRITPDGKLVVFASAATDILAADRDKLGDIYLLERGRNAFRLISVGGTAANPQKGNGDSSEPSIDRGAVRIAFTSLSSNLDDAVLDRDRGANADDSDVFLHDLGGARPTTRLISTRMTPAGGATLSGNGASDQPQISEDGSTLVFRSFAGDLADPSSNEPSRFSEIHLHLLGQRVTLRLNSGRAPDGDSGSPDISEDGRFVVFSTTASTFRLQGVEDKDRVADILLFDRAESVFFLVSLGPRGEKLQGPSTFPRLDRRGGRIAWVAKVDPADLDRPPAAADFEQVLARDRSGNTTSIVSLDAFNRPARSNCTLGDLSGDGNLVLFATAARLTADDLNDVPDAYIRDLPRGRTLLVSRSARTLLAGGAALAPFNGSIADASLDPLGLRDMVFFSPSPELAPLGVLDANQADDVFAAAIVAAPGDDLPPSNHLVAAAQGRATLVQLGLDGRPSGAVFAPDLQAAAFGGLGVDAENRLWAVGDNRLFSLGALDLREKRASLALPFERDERALSLAPREGGAWIATDRRVFFAVPGTGAAGPQIASIRLPQGTAGERLAPDPTGGVWLLATTADGSLFQQLDRVPEPGGGFEIRTLRRIFRRFAAGQPAGPFHTLALDAAGSILARSKRELAKLSRLGNLIWSRFVAAGDGLAVDGAGNVFTLAGGSLIGFGPDGKLLGSIRLDVDPNAGATLAFDGEGRIWVLSAGAKTVLRITFAAQTATPFAFDGLIGDARHGDVTGFVAANVTAPKADSDEDKFANRSEILDGANPFDPTPEPGRFPPLSGLIAEVLAGNQVRLEWTSPAPFCIFEVTRNRLLIGQKAEPVAGEADRFFFIDQSPPGGFSRYRVVGRDLAPCDGLRIVPAGDDERGGGAGAETASSGAVETSVTIGEGVLVGEACNSEIGDLFASEATAVAVNAAENEAAAALAGGIVAFFALDAGGLALKDSAALPAPLDEAFVTGIEYDPADQRFLYLLDRDGALFRYQSGAAVAAELFDLNAVAANLPAGFDAHEYYGLEARGDSLLTVQNSIIFSISEPGIDCLIGFKPDGPDAGRVVAVRRSIDGAAGVFACRDTRWAAGLALLDGAGARLAAGLGFNPSTIDEIAEVDAGDGEIPIFSAGDSALPLDTELLGDVADFDYAPRLGRLIVAASGGRLCLLSSSFPPAPSASFEPEAAKFDEPVELALDVDYGPTGKNFAELAIGVFVDGAQADLAASVFDDVQKRADLRVTLDETPRRTRNVTVSIHSTEGSFTCEVALGFIRGDANNDGIIDISDAIRILIHLFVDGAATLPCADAANVNDSIDGADGHNTIDITDASVLLNFLYRGGPPPSPPFPGFGLDRSTDDTTECSE
jgi:Tol biopolymer transport system component